MVSTKLTLIALLVATLATTTFTAPNYNGCSTINNIGECVECFERKLLLDGGGCGPALPKTDKCLFYVLGFKNGTRAAECGICKPGYANKIEFKTDSIIQKCVNATLTNCLQENDLVFPNGLQRTCIACANNEYSVENKTTKTATCQKIDKPVPNCKWGSVVVPAFGKAACARCNDGFAVNLQTR